MIAGNVDIESGGVLAFNRFDNITFAGNISGDGAVAYMGPGIVTLTGINTYTGGTAITGGIVQAGSDSVFGTAGAMLTLCRRHDPGDGELLHCAARYACWSGRHLRH